MKRSFAAVVVLWPCFQGMLIESASAQVVEWEMVKATWYTQTIADTQPAAPVEFSGEVYVVITSPADITAGEVSSAMGPHALSEDGLEWFGEAQFATLADLNMVWPGGMSYTISITAGDVAPLSQVVMLGADDFPSAAPYLTGASFDYLSGIDPSLPIPLTWSTPASVSAIAIFVDIFRVLGGGGDELVLEFNSLDAMSSGATVPADTLVAGETYRFEIGVTNAQFLSADEMGFDAEGIIAYDSITSFEFTAGGMFAAPCPGDANTDSIVNFGDITSVLNNWLSNCGM